MLSQLKAGLVVGTIFVGAIPPTVILIKGWTALDPAVPSQTMATAGLFSSAQKLPPRLIVPASLPPDSLLQNQLRAGFDILPAEPAVPLRGTLTPSDVVTAASSQGVVTTQETGTSPTPLLPPVSASSSIAGDPPVAVTSAAETQPAASPQPEAMRVAALDPPSPDAVPSPDVAATKPVVARPIGQAALRALVEKEARADKVPEKMALAVVDLESGFNPAKHGEDGKLGLFQIRYTVARALGFKGSAEDLSDPATNVKWGMKYLAGAYKRAGGDTCKTAMKFVAGHYQETYKPAHAAYCKKLEDRMAALE